jgi:hypothetical protein
MRINAAIALFVIPTFLLAGGCGSLSSSGYSVSGTVTWKGQPLDQGSIQFIPEGGQEKAQMVGSEIKGGHYALPNPPGLAPGTYKVRINSRSGINPAGPPDANLADPSSKERIAKKYNEETTLKAEVKPGQANTFDFAVD